MKKLLTVTAISVAVMLVLVPIASAQQEKAPAPPAQERPPAGGGAPQAEKTFQGQLTKVDAQAKSITVKGAAEEMTFDYTDGTQVTGSEKSVQGLAGKTGTELKVTYRDAAGKHMATKIEAIEKGGK